MAQYDKLVSAFDAANHGLSFKVGTVDIVANRLYKQHTDNTLIIAGDNETVPLFVPLTAEKAGYPVQAVPLGLGVFTLTGSGAITAGAALSSAASGKVKAAVGGDPVVTHAYNTAADGELVSVVPAGSGDAGGAAIVASGTAVLVAGTVTVATTAILATDVVQLTRQVTGGTVGHLTVGTIVAGTSFVINSSSGTDTSTVGWTIVR